MLSLTTVVFVVAAPDEGWSRVVTAAIAAGLLAHVVHTSRALPARRLVAAAAALGLAGVAATSADPSVTRLVTAVLVTAPPALTAHGVVALVRDHGVTVQAVAGALAVYLMAGLWFAFVHGSMAAVTDAPLFGSAGDGTASELVYFSFAALTTTGFGDLAAATAAGRALVVLETVCGQLYLVTVVAVLVGRVQRRRPD